MAELSFPFPAELTRQCVQCAQRRVWRDSGSGSSHQARAEGASLPQAFCCRAPRRCLAVQAHLIPCLFSQEQLCPKRQIPALFAGQETGHFVKGCL